MRVNLPIATLYNYNSSIFDGVYIKGATKDEFIEHFLLSYGDLTPIYPDISYLSRFISSLGKSLKWSIDHLWEITQLEYNPIENYDRQETWTDSGNGTFQKGDVTTSETLQKGNVTTTYGKGSESTHKVAAFNAADAQLADTDTVTDSGTDTQSFGADRNTGNVHNALDTSTSDSTHSGRVHGNIGVTTAQQMIESEIDLATKFVYLDKVCKLYADRLLISVW